jgi:hypothetical protein
MAQWPAAIPAGVMRCVRDDRCGSGCTVRAVKGRTRAVSGPYRMILCMKVTVLESSSARGETEPICPVKKG